MKIGVISDIHDHINNLRQAIKILNNKKVDLVFFCGDLSSPFTLDTFKDLKAPVKAVFGNNEGDKVSIFRKKEKEKLNFEYAPKRGLMWDLKLKGKRIAVFHGHQAEITNSLVHSKLFDFVFTGHTHNSHIKQLGKTLWVNPGNICGWTGLDLKPVKPSLAIIDLKTKSVKIIRF